MKNHRPTTQRPRRKRRAADEAAAPAERAEAPAQSLETLRSPQAGPAQRGQAALGLQRTVGNMAIGHELVQRQAHKKRRTNTTFHQQVVAVRDGEIGMGGSVVADLASLKQHLMRLRNRGEWTLVLAIHGSENRVAAQSPPDWQRNAVFYEAADINQLFSEDHDWVDWRDEFGPKRIALTSCQVSAGLERTFITNFTRHAAGSGSQSVGPTQQAQGLGHDCMPSSSAQYLTLASGQQLRSRRQFMQLGADEKQEIIDPLKQLNQTYGYYGNPPVPEDQILDYFFDEDPKAAWAVVTVAKKQHQGPDIQTDIPFWNRSFGPRSFEFHQLCDQGIGKLKPR